jgi:hypothetical protein
MEDEKICRNCDYVEDMCDRTDLGICVLRQDWQAIEEKIDPLVDGTSWCPHWCKRTGG